MPEQGQPTIKEQRDLKQQEKERRRALAARQERTKNIVTWSIVGLVAVGIIALVVVTAKNSGGNGTAVATVTADDHIQGPASAKAVIIEYSDFQCPACGAYYPIIKNLQQTYGDKIATVYRNYPLTTLHQYAQLAAQAAEAAQLQGKYWEMHDLLFQRQDSWSKGGNVKQTFTDYAKELGLDTKKFGDDIDSTTVKDRVSRDVNSGNLVAITGTPTFFLNGKKLANPGSEDAFRSLIDAALGTTNQ